MPAVTPRPTFFENVLPAAQFESLRLYARALAESPYVTYEAWASRLVRHDDPYLALLHPALVPLVEPAAGEPVKPSYVFFASYLDGALLPPHTDREQCRHTFDLCLEDTGEAWPLVVGGEEYVLRENEGLLYRGCDLEHSRGPKPAGKVARLAFYHFVARDFAGPLK